jgi:hypothetical protein
MNYTDDMIDNRSLLTNMEVGEGVSEGVGEGVSECANNQTINIDIGIPDIPDTSLNYDLGGSSGGGSGDLDPNSLFTQEQLDCIHGIVNREIERNRISQQNDTQNEIHNVAFSFICSTVCIITIIFILSTDLMHSV